MYRHLCLSFFASISILFSFPYELNAQLHLDLSENTNLTFLQIVDSVESYYEVMGKDKGKGYKIYQRWKYENERSLDSSGRIVNRKTQAKIYENFLSKQKKTKHLDVTFEELGPLTQTNTATWSSSLGRISAIGLDSKDSTHIIVGSPSGGIWKTNNRGTSWKAVYDYATNIDILSLCISHADSNMYWAGTSDKIIHSGDGGKNWHHVINGPTGRINTIIMDPSNSKVLLSSERWGGKIHRSADGGVTWTEVYNGNRAYDIEFHPNNSDTIYASGQGYIVRSVDNGLTWTTINGGPWTNTGVIMLAVSKNAPDYVYALQESSGGYNGTFRSMDKGATWVTQSDNSSGENNILTYEQESQGGQSMLMWISCTILTMDYMPVQMGEYSSALMEGIHLKIILQVSVCDNSIE